MSFDITELMVEASKAGADVRMRDGKFYIYGFYKNGEVFFVPKNNDCCMACLRYSQEYDICSFFDIVRLNYEEWLCYKDKWDGWSQPESWVVPFLIKEGYIKKESKTIYSPVK